MSVDWSIPAETRWDVRLGRMGHFCASAHVSLFSPTASVVLSSVVSIAKLEILQSFESRPDQVKCAFRLQSRAGFLVGFAMLVVWVEDALLAGSRQSFSA